MPSSSSPETRPRRRHHWPRTVPGRQSFRLSALHFLLRAPCHRHQSTVEFCLNRASRSKRNQFTRPRPILQPSFPSIPPVNPTSPLVPPVNPAILPAHTFIAPMAKAGQCSLSGGMPSSIQSSFRPSLPAFGSGFSNDRLGEHGARRDCRSAADRVIFRRRDSVRLGP